MVEKWNNIIDNSQSGKSAVIDVNMWFGKATIDAYVSALLLGGSVGSGLTVNPYLNRVGAGAFEYDFGALDDADNPLTKSYMNLMYDHCARSGVPVTLTICHNH